MFAPILTRIFPKAAAHAVAAGLILLPGIAEAQTGKAAPALTGRYSVEGQNAQGAVYRGSATIRQTGQTYQIVWTIGQSTYSGTAIFDQDVLAVGVASQVVLYRIAPDGRLFGLWTELGASKLMREVLVPQK